jgi:Pretoxin HINT domain/HEAT repeats
MTCTMILYGAILVALPTAAEPQAKPPDLDTYAAAKAKAGKSPDAQVKLALWCEAHGLSAERTKHLLLATLLDPANVAARGLMGLVSYKGKWLKPGEVSQELSLDPDRRALINEYLKRRAATSAKPDSQWKLAQWCEQNGLRDQAQAHYWAVIRLDRGREAAWKKLGYKKHGDAWARPEQILAEKIEAEKQRAATQHWKPILERYRADLRSKDATRRTRAETALAQITDPRAVPAVWQLLGSSDQRLQIMAVQVLGQIEGPAASRAVAAMAVFSPYADLRGRATETLSRRDPSDFLDSLLSMIHRPFRYKVQPLNGPGSAGGVFVDGERFDIRRLYEVDPINPNSLGPRIFSPEVPFNPFSVPNMLMASGWQFGGVNLAPSVTPASPQRLGKAIATNPAGALVSLERRQTVTGPGWGNEAYLVYATQAAAIQRDQQNATEILEGQRMAQLAQESLASDIQMLESWNDGIRQVNDRVLPILKTATGEDFGSDREAWLKWWNNELGYAYESPPAEEKPTLTEFVSIPSRVYDPNHQCFAAGTPVQTIAGPQPIEKVAVGDQVLSQNTTTGALSFQPVIEIHRNPPTTTLNIRLGGEALVATGIHRFWKTGKGWTMARDLKRGDTVRTTGGSVRIESIEPGPVGPVFNLTVAHNSNFFVGQNRCLVYDFSIVQPVWAPFDIVPDLQAVQPGTKARAREVTR